MGSEWEVNGVGCLTMVPVKRFDTRARLPLEIFALPRPLLFETTPTMKQTTPISNTQNTLFETTPTMNPFQI